LHRAPPYSKQSHYPSGNSQNKNMRLQTACDSFKKPSGTLFAVSIRAFAALVKRGARLNARKKAEESTAARRPEAKDSGRQKAR